VHCPVGSGVAPIGQRIIGSSTKARPKTAASTESRSGPADQIDIGERSTTPEM
jgi:hypothetical protein